MSWRNWSLDMLSALGAAARSWRKAFAAALLPLGLILSLAGCGFQPIAASSSAIGQEDLVLADLQVTSDDSRFAYRVKKEMLRSIQIDPAASYRFLVNGQIERTGLAIEQNDTVTRQNVAARTTYSLARRETGKPQSPEPEIKGETRVTTAVNTTASQYSASVSDREAVERLAKETARRLITFLRVNKVEAPYGG